MNVVFKKLRKKKKKRRRRKEKRKKEPQDILDHRYIGRAWSQLPATCGGRRN
jgi:hypothetical protein